MAVWDTLTRALSWPSPTHRFEDLGTTPLSTLNPSSSGFYESLVSALDGITSGGLSGLPSVSMQNVGMNSVVYLAMALKGGTIASMPLQMFEEATDGSSRRVKPRENRSIWDEPNPEETPQEFWETEFSHLDLAGDLFIYCERDSLGNVVEFHGIHPHRMQVGRNPKTMRKVYVLDSNEDAPMASARLFEGEILHVRNLTWGRKGLRGFGLIDLARLELQVDAAAAQYGARFFADGSTPGGVLTSDADIPDEVAERLQARWEKAHKGLSKSHKIAVLGNGGKYQATAATPEQAQALPTRTNQIKVLARFTGVPTHLLMDSTGSTTWGTGLEELGQGFVTYTLARTSKRVEQALRRILPDNRYAKWNYDALLRGSNLKRMQSYQIGRIVGLYSKDDLRRMEDEPPIPDEDRWKYSEPLTSNVAAATPAADPAMEKDPEAVLAEVSPDAGNVAAQALNGAQIASLVEVLTQVTAGQISPSVAKAILQASFPFIDAAILDKMVDDAEAFEPDPLAV